MDEQYQVRSPLGILVIHGFTATLDSVKLLSLSLLELGIPFSVPLLTGHGASSPEALRGVKWDRWMADAEEALHKLTLEAEQIIVIGHSMGAILSLNLAVRHQEKIDSLVLATPAIKLVSLLAPGRPFHFAAPFLGRIIRNWELKSDFSKAECAPCTPHYAWVPTDAIISLFDLINKSRQLPGRITVPVLIIHCRKERTVRPESAIMLYNEIATPLSEKSLIWLERSGHQLFCDCEKEKAVEAIIDYLCCRIERKKRCPSDALC